jgi:hypothetical protein
MGQLRDHNARQTTRLCAVGTTIRCNADQRQNGGSARGYQGLSALLAISTTGEQQAARAVCLCMASAGRECALLPR